MFCSLIYPACNAHAPYYAVICSLSGCTALFHVISLPARFTEIRQEIQHKIVFWFFYDFYSEIFLILRRIRRGIVINMYRSLFLSDCKEKLNFLVIFSTNPEISKSIKIPSVEAEFWHTGRDGTD